MKAYETKNTHEANNEAIEAGNTKLHNLIEAAWAVCGRLDPMWECDAENFACIIETMHEAREDALAVGLAEEAAKVYGDTEQDGKTFGVVVHLWTGDWGYEVHDGDTYVAEESARGFGSYEEAYDAATSNGYRWECATA